MPAYSFVALRSLAFSVALLLSSGACQERGFDQETYVNRPDVGGGTVVQDAASPDRPAPLIPDAGPRLDACVPRAETCNGFDDDCNGRVDDVPATELQNNVLQCGSCDTSCLPVPMNAEAACNAGKCEYACKGGWIDVNKSRADGCECLQSGDEICDGRDNDCDGMVDEMFDLMTDPNHCGGCGMKCQVPGAEAACAAGKCTIKSCLPGFFDANRMPADGCEATCVPSNNGVELCDGRDNDCDGKVDELSSEMNRTMDEKLVYLGAPHDVTMFAFEASRPDATDASAGANNTVRPCSSPARLPWTDVTKEEARDACKALGGNWRLCTEKEWYAACSKEGANAFPYGATYDPMKCNGADYRPAGPAVVPGGSAAGCAAMVGAGTDDKIMDLSGNVREWVTNGNNFELRGGAYNVASFSGDAPGLKCTSALPAPMTPVRLPSVGFRCCLPGRLPAM